MFKAFLFDLDGTLINTEALYTESSNELLAEHGLGPLTWDVKVKLQGLPGISAAAEFLRNYPELESKYTPQEWLEKAHAYQQTKWGKTQFMPGAKEILEWGHEHKVPMALATSSLHNNYVAKTTHLREQFDYFGHHIVTGDDPRIPEGRGKPYPDIWHTALQSLNEGREVPIKPEECLVFEDAVPGLKSAVAFEAGRVIWIPDEHVVSLYSEQELKALLGTKVSMLSSLADFNPHEFVKS